MSYGVWHTWQQTAHRYSHHTTRVCLTQTIELSDDESIDSHDQDLTCDQIIGSSV